MKTKSNEVSSLQNLMSFCKVLNLHNLREHIVNSTNYGDVKGSILFSCISSGTVLVIIKLTKNAVRCGSVAVAVNLLSVFISSFFCDV